MGILSARDDQYGLLARQQLALQVVEGVRAEQVAPGHGRVQVGKVQLAERQLGIRRKARIQHQAAAQSAFYCCAFKHPMLQQPALA